ncbi:hypothetical protein [Vulcanisaeta sp. JCM 16159]|uniref:hypothetical protein n=1 Tax=Vulcanisaeta sp. JCM 16159 TaxID=1295371 RepID=UPI000A4B40E6|nr:hypothetical protein [Vulcanisaeta sp. JCM 16159]
MRILIKWCGLPWCMFAGSWLFEGLNVVKYVRDATPVAPPEPIVELSNVNGDVLRQLLSRLRQLISLASAVAWAKRVGLRVFIYGSAVPDPVSDFIRASLAGGADGILVDDFISINSDLIDVVHVNQRVGDDSVNYVIVSPDRPYQQSVRAYGVIVKDGVIDRDWLLRVRDRFRIIYGSREFLVMLDNSLFRREVIEELQDVVDGVVITEVPSLVSLDFDNYGAINVFRCINCYIDFETEGEMRKCPRCSNRLRPIIRRWDKFTVIEPKVLRLKAVDEIRYMRLGTPKVINY